MATAPLPAPPMAFLSYARADSNRLGGLIGMLRQELPGGMGEGQGPALQVVEDRDGAGLARHGAEIEALARRGAAFLVPLVSPRYLASAPCRAGLARFLGLERDSGRGDLILPLYVETLPARPGGVVDVPAELERALFERRYRDWRNLVDGPLDGLETLRRLRGLGEQIRRSSAPSWPEPSDDDQTAPAAALPPAGVAAAGRSFEPAAEPAGRARPAARPGLLPAVILGLSCGLLAVLLALFADALLEWSPAARRGRLLEAALAEAAARAEGAAARAAAAEAELARRAAEAAALADELAAGRAALALAGRERAALEAEIARLGKALHGAELHAAAGVGARIAGTSFRDCPECPEMVLLPGGSFRMGSGEAERQRIAARGGDPSWSADERPQHEVLIAPGLAVARREITRGEFRRFVAATGHAVAMDCRELVGRAWHTSRVLGWQTPDFLQGDDHPVVCVSFADALAYAQWIGGLAGRPYRLLSEAEWEHAARAGMATARYWGDDPQERAACAFANGLDRSATAMLGRGLPGLACDDGAVHTAAAGSYAANPFGLFDMLGNAAEWVLDCYHPTYDGAPADGSPRTDGDCTYRVTRGGSFLSLPRALRAAARNRLEPDARNVATGFRLATRPGG
jgi:formylglycine-generating enzyme required for sulfatase activity